jgi:hypothetical protein
MVILRPTRKLYGSLAMSPNIQTVSDTALGDWYVNRIVVGRRPLLLLLSSASLLPAVVPARDVQKLPARLASIIERRLRRLGVDQRVIDVEVAAMGSVVIEPTTDRSVLGIMVDLAKGIPYYLKPGRWTETTLDIVEQRLAETPCRAGQRSDRVIFPAQRASELLRSRWLASVQFQPTTYAPVKVH